MVAIEQSLQQLSFEKKVITLLRSITLRADTRSLLYCLLSTVLGPQESSVEKMAALMFPSTNSTADGSRQFSGSGQQNVVPGHAVPVAIEPES